MKRPLLYVYVVGALLSGSTASHRARSASPPVRAPAAGQRVEYWPGLGNVVVSTAQPGGQQDGNGGNGGDGDDDNPNQRFHPATVYVDGVARVAFTYNEMPPEVKTSKYDWEPGTSYTHIRVCDYFKSVGANCDRVKESHWYGGRDRVVIVTGEMLRKHRNDLYFNFTRELFGKPRLEVRGEIVTNDIVDVVTDVAIYVGKKPPRWDREQWALVDDRGQPIDGIPYAHESMPRRAVRVNVDGRLVALVKRNLLEGNVPCVNEGAANEDPRYRLNDLLAANHLAPSAFRGIDLVTRDERVIRLSASDARRGVEFTAPRHAGGEVLVYFGGRQARASVFNLYVERQPPRREMRTMTVGPATPGVRLAGATALKSASDF
jgi:hypothetical protein